MAEDSTYYDLVDRYLTGQLSETEIAEFVTEVKTNADLAKELAFQQKIGAVLKTGQSMDLASRLKDIGLQLDEEEKVGEEEKEATLPPKRKTWPIWQRMAIAASFALLATFFIRSLIFPSVDTMQLYADNYSPYPTNSTRKPSAELERAVLLYENNKYIEALPSFEAVDPGDSLYNEWSMYRGICYLEISKLVNSQNEFQRLLDEGGVFYEESARWYLALTYLKSGNKKMAKETLQAFVDQNSTYKKDQVEKLLRVL